MKPHLPTRFDVSIGGYPGPFYSIRWDGKCLQYSGRDDEDFVELAIQPHGRTWVAFWRAMDRVNARHWRRSYVDLDVLDGTSWHAHIEWDGQLIKSSGSNAYPGETPRDIKRGIPAKAFPQFCAAVRKLTRQRFA